MHRVTIEILSEPLAICRLAPGTRIPAWATARQFLSITRAPEELSIVCASGAVPQDVTASTGWRALKLRGPFALDVVGVMLSVAQPLAAASVAIMPIGTYDTDYVLVREAQLPQAIAALEAAGHEVVRE